MALDLSDLSFIDATGLAALLSFRQLQDATGLAVDQQLAFYQNIDCS